MRIASAVVAVALSIQGCAECAVDADCGLDICSDGVCASGTDLVVSSSTREADGTYTVRLVARIPGSRSQIRVTRLGTDFGDACVPFNPLLVDVVNQGDAFDPVEIEIAGLPQLGVTFALRFTLLSGATNVGVTTSLTGPALADDIGGFSIISPLAGELDVVATPVVDVEVEGIDDVDSASVIVRPQTGPALPRGVLRRNGETVQATALLARGPQVVEVEAVVGGAVRRCAVAVEGTSPGEAEIELLLVAEPQNASDRDDGATAWLELSTFGETGICDATVDAASSCRSAPAPRTPAVRTIHQLTTTTPSSSIEVGVMPVIASLPVSAVVRVTHLGAHVGVFGPVTIAPAAGEAWLAGALVVRDGAVVLTPSAGAPQPGLPWQ